MNRLENNELQTNLEWNINVSILTNRFVMGEVFKVFGISISILGIFAFLISLPQIFSGHVYTNSSNSRDSKYALILLSIWLLLSAIFILLYYGNRYSIKYIINDKEVWFKTMENQRKKNRLINTLLMFGGAASGNLSYVGTGLINNSRQDMGMKFKNVTKAVFYDNKSTITLRGGFGVKMIIFCHVENYYQVKAYVDRLIPKNCYRKQKGLARRVNF